MVTKAIQKGSVKRLREIAKKLKLGPYPESLFAETRGSEKALKFFLRLPSADHRMPPKALCNNSRSLKSSHSLKSAGYRVRALKTHKGTIIIKYPHNNMTAKQEIKKIRKIVDIVNSKNPSTCILLKPKAHAVGPFIVMKKTNLPSIIECAHVFTLRGQRMVIKLAKRAGVSPQEIEHGLDKASYELNNFSDTFESRNLLVAGMKEGKFVLIPLIDYN